jgi:predicted DNA-binding protein (MmcQ/YjbR family)
MTGEATRNRHENALRKFAMSLPEAVEEFPWGHRAIKVRKKTFLFLAVDRSELSLSVKLPRSGSVALSLPFASPTAYGLGKSGWITARFEKGKRPPMGLLEEWIEESYRAIAPSKLVATLGK